MNIQQLEHIIRASGEIAGVQEIFILGSQSILAQHPELGSSFLGNVNMTTISLRNTAIYNLVCSMEADIIINSDNKSTMYVSGSLGEYSDFHNTHGYYVDVIDDDTCKLPLGWEQRLKSICNINTNYIVGKCLEKHDMIIAKLVANRDKDIEYFKAAIRLSLLKKRILLKRLDITPGISDIIKNRIKNQIKRAFQNEQASDR